MSLHNCPPPPLDDLFDKKSNTGKKYGHLLLESIVNNNDELLLRLKAYFESAHLDARDVIHNFAGISLHPDYDETQKKINYPSSLHPTTLKGLFGEVMAGLVAESYELVGKHKWEIPVFLFRFHEDAKKYLYTLVRDPTQERKTIGRLGTDFIGISIVNGEVSRIISGEAKWRKTLTQGVIEDVMLGTKKKGEKNRTKEKGIWAKLNKEVNPPNGLRELQIALKDIAPDKYADVILSMDKQLMAFNAEVVPKTNLVLIVGEPTPNRKKGQPLIKFGSISENYLATYDLQVVEIVLPNGEDLIMDLYASLWNEDK